jgi:hypothetical protein
MSVSSIVRVSFQTNVTANQAVNSALVGHTQNAQGPGPFTKVGTAAYTVTAGNDSAVAAALADLGKAIASNAADLDFLSVSLVRVP